MTTAAGRGHPRHQLRPFTVTVRNRRERGRPELVIVTAQTERDAILRAGLTLAERHPGAEPGDWYVGQVTDPAPFTWTPGEEDTA